MFPFFKASVVLVAAGTLTFGAQDKASPKTDAPSAGRVTTAHNDVDATTKATGKAKAALVPQTTCPVMGGKINKKLFVDYQGKRIYVCCPGCTAALAKDPAKYIKKLEAMGQSVEVIDSAKATQSSAATAKVQAKPAAAPPTAAPKLVAQKTCPVMGNPIDKSVYVDYKGKRVYFCCSMCPATFKQDPEKYLKVLADKGEAVEAIGKK